MAPERSPETGGEPDEHRRPMISRRRVLQAASVGSLGAITGLGAGAVLIDDEPFVANALAAGEIDLTTTWTDGSSGATTVSSGGVTLDVGPLSPGDRRWAVLTVDLPQGSSPNNPAYLWLRTTCPSPANGLLVDLSVTLTYADANGQSLGVDRNPIFDGSLCDLANALRNGVALDGDPRTPGRDCLDTASTGPLYLRIEWELDSGYVGEESTTTEFEIVATQCRHSRGNVNPFPPTEECDCGGTTTQYRGISFVEVYGCLAQAPECACTFLGKLELDDEYASKCGAQGISENRIQVGRYALYEDDDCDDPAKDTGYDLHVTDIAEPDSETIGIAFDLLERGTNTPGPDLCKVVIKGGPGTVVYDAGDLGARSNSTEGLLMGVPK